MEFPVPFIGPTYQNAFLPARAQRCVNIFPKAGVLKGRPGYTTWTTVGNGSIRGMINALNKLYAVSGTDLYEISTDGTGTNIGTLNTSASPISMATNGSDLIIVDGVDGWTYDGTTFAQITDVDFTGTITKPKFVSFFGGFYFVMNDGEQKIYKSENKYDAANWSGEFASAEYHPDDLSRIISLRADLWLIGKKTLESWFYSGADFPVDPNPNTFQDYGTTAPYSVTRIDNGLAWIGSSAEVDRVALKTTGYRVQRISTPAIEKEWASYSTVNDCIGFSFKYPGLGHFLVFQFPTADKTWVWDAEENMWHEWERYAQNIEDRGRHPANCYCLFDGKHLIGDYQTGKIYQMSDSVYTDDGTTILADRMGPDLYTAKNRVFYHQLEVDMQVGVGLTSSSSGVVGSDPQLRLYYSDDRGNTWSGFKQGSMGKIGEYDTRVIFRRLGSSRNRIFRITMDAPVQRNIINAVVDGTQGTV